MEFETAEDVLEWLRTGAWKNEQPKRRCGGKCQGCTCKPQAPSNWHNEVMGDLGHFEGEKA